MNAPDAPHGQQLARLREMVAALECGDEALYESQMVQLLRERESGLFVSIARLTRELHSAIFESKLDGKLSALAQEQIPDACSRLDYVVQLTENAAHKTLDLVERSRESLVSLQRADNLIAALPPQDQLAQAHVLLVSGISALRSQLTQLAQAQEYQDLSGQLIKRVIALVRGVESALLEVLRAAGPLQLPTSAPIAALSAAPAALLQGPAVPGLTGAQVSQQDADALLSSLGF